MNSIPTVVRSPERIVALDDPATGLRGYIVVDSVTLGPAAGGCRIWRYESDEAALDDALRLSRGMTYKNALAGLPLGGGKAVIIEPRGHYDRAALFRAFGDAVAALDGTYVTAEDVGTSVEDMTHVAERTQFVSGLVARTGMPGGDPSPYTAAGVFSAMNVAAQKVMGSSLNGLTVGVQGIGSVGFALCELLSDAGARILVADPREAVVARAQSRFRAVPMTVESLLSAEMDIFAPCALGGVLSSQAIAGLRAKIVCGAANNQLVDDHQVLELQRRNVLYLPDYLVNSGGIIAVAGEYLGWQLQDVRDGLGAISERVVEVLEIAQRHDMTPLEASKRLVLKRLGWVAG